MFRNNLTEDLKIRRSM